MLLLHNSLVFSQVAKENHSRKIISEILETKQKIIENSKLSADSFIFLSFWDFDGTIIKGDCSEGLVNNDSLIYKGLAQVAIETGYSPVYAAKGGSKKFFDDYFYMSENIGNWLALPFLAQIFKGTKVTDIYNLSEEYIKTTQSKYYFKSTIKIINALEDNNIECHIMSGSPDVFVDAAATSLGLPQERFNGIELQIEDGKLTEKLIYPVTRSYGKVEKLEQIVEENQNKNPSKKVVVLAAFGNSYQTDGPFLKYVVTQKLPKSKPIAVMINGGEIPEDYQGLFIQVQQSEIIGDNKSNK